MCIVVWVCIVGWVVMGVYSGVSGMGVYSGVSGDGCV